MNCLFCKIANKEIASDIIWEDDSFIAFKDIHPKAETHLLIVPKKHIDSVDTLEETDILLAGQLVAAAKNLAHQLGLKSRYKLIFNVGRGGGQMIDHIHLHFLSGKEINLP